MEEFFTLEKAPEIELLAALEEAIFGVMLEKNTDSTQKF
jgi:hypothetical protein